jgi:hypothetical protein
MARSEKAVVSRDQEGNPVRNPVGEFFDFGKPQADPGGGVPEFANVTPKKQLITVPNKPGGTIRVSRFGILYGAQWREVYATAGKKWGPRTPFIERERGKDGKFDPKYLLTAEQMVGELRALDTKPGNLARVRALVDNAVFAVDKNGRSDPDGLRSRDDRVEVLKVENEVARSLERKAAELKRREQG